MLLNFNGVLVSQLGGDAVLRWATAFVAGSLHEVERASCDRGLVDWRKHLRDNPLYQ